MGWAKSSDFVLIMAITLVVSWIFLLHFYCIFEIKNQVLFWIFLPSVVPDRPASIIAQNAVNPAIQQQYILSIINKQLTSKISSSFNSRWEVGVICPSIKATKGEEEGSKGNKRELSWVNFSWKSFSSTYKIMNDPLVILASRCLSKRTLLNILHVCVKQMFVSHGTI